MKTNTEQAFLKALEQSTGDIFLAHHTISPLPKDFYPSAAKQIAYLVGNETDSRNYAGALRHLNTNFALHLNSPETEILNLLLLELDKAVRYESEITLPIQYRENSAVHSCHCPVVLHELIRQASLLSSTGLDNCELNAIRLNCSLMLLVHDMGEILGEFSSLARRVMSNNIQEVPILERRIFKLCLIEAAKAASEVTAEWEFHHKIMNMRKDLARFRSNGTYCLADVRSYLDQIEKQQDTSGLTDITNSYVKRFLHLWTAIEFADQLDIRTEASRRLKFQSLFAKCCEHVQGTRHLLRFARLGYNIHDQQKLNLFNPHSSTNIEPYNAQIYQPAIPFNLVTSYRIIRNSAYDETGLAALCRTAKTDIEKDIATVTTRAIFLTTIERLRNARPVIDRQITSQTDDINKCMSEFSQVNHSDQNFWPMRNRLEENLRIDLENEQNSYAQQISKNKPSGLRLQNIESRQRLMALYLKAVISGYQPKSAEILMQHKGKLPNALHGFDALVPLFTHPVKKLTAANVDSLTDIHQSGASIDSKVKRFVRAWCEN